MAAAQSTPTTFETAMLRNRKRPSGISGAATLDSITRNTASSTAAAPSTPRVWAEVQPSWLPFTIA